MLTVKPETKRTGQLESTFANRSSHGDTGRPAVSGMRSFGHFLEAQRGKGLMIFDQLHPGLEFNELPSVLARNALGRGHESSCHAFMASAIRNSHLANIDAVVTDCRERATDDRGSVDCDDQCLILSLGTKFVDIHPA